MKILPWDYAARNLGRNKLRLLSSVAGCLLVTLLVLSAAAFVRGMEKSLRVSGMEKNVLLIGAGSEESLERSEIGNGVASVVAASVQGIKTRLGVPYISPEIQMATLIQLEKDSPHPELALLRGITSAAFLVHPQVRITDGRSPGPNEMLAGKLAGARIGVSEAQLATGKSLWFDGRPVTISGHFEAPNTVMEAELWLPLKDVQIAARRDNVSTVVMTLDDAEFDDIDVFCKSRLDLELVAVRESDYYAKLAEFYQPVKSIVWITALLIALAGLFGGLNTMYAAFAARTRELGMLQCLGFSRTALVLGMMQESMFIAIAGGMLAVAVGFFLLDGVAIRISMGAFGLAIDTPVIAAALTAAFALGIFGALPPAWSTLKLPICEALKK